MNPSLTEIGSHAFWLPQFEPVLLFFLFAVAAVHICQRLLEGVVTLAAGRERQAALARSAMCIGCIAWALDAAGLLMYAPLAAARPRLAAALLALLMMVASARWSIPVLAAARSPMRIAAASLGLALGMLAGNVILLSAFGTLAGGIRWPAGIVALASLAGAAAWLALRHAQARAPAPLSWGRKLLGAGLAVPLHVCLANLCRLTSANLSGKGGPPLWLALALFGVASAGYQLRGLRIDARQKRSASLMPQQPEHEHGHEQAQAREGGHRGDDDLLALLVERLPELLKPERIRLHFQPIVPAADQPGPIRFEALLRIDAPDLPRIDPELFFLACARLGQASQADRLIIAHALHVSQKWWPDPDCGGITVNVTPESLCAPDFAAWLTRQLRQTRCPRHWLMLELTEHALISNAQRLTRVVQELARQGVGVLMDDFGAGYSSLAMLGELPVKGIKCDRAFVGALQHNPRRQTLLRHVCAMARELNLPVTVEGIETEGDFSIVRRLGANHVQGYLFARPMPSDDVPAWLGAYGFSSRQ